jgi:dihydrofolate reductase
MPRSIVSMKIAILVAVAENGVIGRDNQLIWRLPDDLKRFKTLTMGHPMIMGRKTFESIGKPLPGRTTIVLTRSDDYNPAGILLATSLEEVIWLADAVGTGKAFIVGGGEIYRQALAQRLVGTIYLTRVHAQVEGDTFFEIPEPENWEEKARTFHPKDEKHKFDFEFVDLTANYT